MATMRCALASAALRRPKGQAARVRVRGGLKAIEPGRSGGFRLRYEAGPAVPEATVELSGETSGDALSSAPIVRVSHCVNCTGVGFDVADDRTPLMRQLLREGIVRPHRFGGVVVDPDSFRVLGDETRGGQVEQNLFVVGHNARGVRYLTSGLGFLRSMIGGVVADVARQLGR